MHTDSETTIEFTEPELRQGDIVEFHSPVTQSPWPRLGVVINADCDMANCNHDDVIAFLPIYTFAEYFIKFVIPNLLAAKVGQLEKTFTTICKFTSPEEILALKRWLRDEAHGEVAEKLAAELHLSQRISDQLNETLKTLRDFYTDDLSHKDRYLKLVAQSTNCKDRLMKDLSEARKGLGNGHLFISEIRGLIDIGYVVRVRRIYTMDANLCYIARANFLATANKSLPAATRVAKFTYPYQVKIAQLFAQQFSRVGLPDDVVALSNVAIESVADDLLGEFR